MAAQKLARVVDFAMSAIESQLHSRETQTRCRMNLDRRDAYAEYMLKHPDEFPPPVIFFDGQRYWIGDGYHRLSAMAKNGLSVVVVVVRSGTKDDAIMHNIVANRDDKLGLQRTEGDKARAVEMLVATKKCYGMKLAEIAALVGCSRTTVHRINKKTNGGFGIKGSQNQTWKAVKDRRKRILEAWSNGESVKAIASREGVTERVAYIDIHNKENGLVKCEHCGGTGWKRENLDAQQSRVS